MLVSSFAWEILNRETESLPWCVLTHVFLVRIYSEATDNIPIRNRDIFGSVPMEKETVQLSSIKPSMVLRININYIQSTCTLFGLTEIFIASKTYYNHLNFIKDCAFSVISTRFLYIWPHQRILIYTKYLASFTSTP